MENLLGGVQYNCLTRADCQRCLYAISCGLCHLVDNCIQYQYSVHIDTCLHHLSVRCPSKFCCLLTQSAFHLLPKRTDRNGI